MANLNKVFLIGNLTADPELRHLPNGTPVADLRMAINRSWTSKDGERREETLYIDVTVWDRVAENCVKSLKRGRPIHVEGYLKMETWESNGEKRSRIKVVADNVQFLDRGERAGDAPAPASRGRAPQPERGQQESYGPPPSRKGKAFPVGPAPAPDDDDLPF